MKATRVVRRTVDVDGESASYLTVDTDAQAVLLLHGTYWSRVWLPVLDHLADAGLRPIAVDLNGLGLSGGELSPETATVPALAGWIERFAEALALPQRIGIAGHDIGGAIAQHLSVFGELKPSALALVNSVTFDSWPVPGVARFRDPAVVAAMAADEMLSSRRAAVTAALAQAVTPALIEEYLEPWKRETVRRSWMHLAGAADSRYTMELVAELQASPLRKLLIWGEDDQFQSVQYAERFVNEIEQSTLVRIPAAGHIPMENAPAVVARALSGFFLGTKTEG